MIVLTVGNLKIYGQSVASRGTTLIVPAYKLVFDCGVQVNEALAHQFKCRTVAVTHGHADHIGSLHYDVFLRIRNSVASASYIVPDECVASFRHTLAACSALNNNSCVECAAKQFGFSLHPDSTCQTCCCNRAPCAIESVQRVESVEFAQETSCADTTGVIGATNTTNELRLFGNSDIYDGFELFGDFVLKSIKTVHSVPSCGYIVYEKRRVLREDLKSLSGDELKKLKKTQGITVERLMPVLAYTGDTTIDGVLQPDFLNADVLICECTYIDESVDAAEARKRWHVHIDDIVANKTRFKNKHVVLCHFSPRFDKASVEIACKPLRSAFPKLHLFI